MNVKTEALQSVYFKIFFQLKEEISRRELEKLQNIQSVIQETRVELKEWWDKCFYSQTQRDEFKDFRNGEFVACPSFAH